mmetsp:Transcript_858/g.1420  ORF Transcript_858/g.1420 Transcript_858/m.1420 type:complete len:221 (-) Transcript_858:908-1570(-)
MERLRRLHSSIHIDQIMTLNIPPLMINRRINNPITDSLGHNKFSTGSTWQSQSTRHILQRYPRITSFQPSQPSLYNRMRQSRNQRIRPIHPQPFGMFPHCFMEHSQIPPPNRLRNLQIRVQLPPHPLTKEHTPIRNLPHEQLYDHQQPLYGNTKSKSGIGRTFPETLTQIGVRLGIFQSQRLHPPRVIQIPQQLIITRRFCREGTIGNQFLSLLDTIRQE